MSWPRPKMVDAVRIIVREHKSGEQKYVCCYTVHADVETVRKLLDKILREEASALPEM